MQTLRHISSLIACSLVAATVPCSHAVVLAGWSQFNTATPGTFPNAAEVTATGIASAGTGFIDAVNLVKNSTGSSTGIFNLGDWNGDSAVDTGQYFQVDIAIASGYTVDFSSVQFYGKYFPSTTGNLELHVRSGPGYSTDISSLTLETVSDSLHTLSLSSVQNATGTVSFRFYGTGGEYTGDSVRLKNNAAVDPSGTLFFTLNGTVSAVPEPAGFAALTGLGLLGFAFWRRQRHSS